MRFSTRTHFALMFAALLGAGIPTAQADGDAPLAKELPAPLAAPPPDALTANFVPPEGWARKNDHVFEHRALGLAVEVRNGPSKATPRQVVTDATRGLADVTTVVTRDEAIASAEGTRVGENGRRETVFIAAQSYDLGRERQVTISGRWDADDSRLQRSFIMLLLAKIVPPEMRRDNFPSVQYLGYVPPGWQLQHDGARAVLVNNDLDAHFIIDVIPWHGSAESFARRKQAEEFSDADLRLKFGKRLIEHEQLTVSKSTLKAAYGTRADGLMTRVSVQTPTAFRSEGVRMGVALMLSARWPMEHHDTVNAEFGRVADNLAVQLGARGKRPPAPTASQ